MSLRQIIKTIVGSAFGLDKSGNPVWNRIDGSQIVLEADATTGVPGLRTTTSPTQGSVETSGSIQLLNTIGQPLSMTGQLLGNIGRRTVILGDSRTQQNYDQMATAITGRPRWFCLSQCLSGQRLDLINNAGVNGQFVADMLARVSGSALGAGFGALGDASTAVASSPGVLGLAPDIVIVNGGYNDIFGNGATAAATYATVVQIFNAVVKAGALLIVCTVAPPNSAASGYTPTRAAELRVYNNLLIAYANATRGVYLADFYAALTNPNGTTASASLEGVATDYRDGTIHENNRGGYKEGKVLSTLISAIVPVRTELLPVSNAETIALNASIPFLQVNPLLTGTAAISATGFSGTTAGSNLVNANFVTGGTMATVLSAVAQRQGYGQAIRMTCTASANNDSAEIRFPTVHASLVVGGTYIAVCEIAYTGASAAALATTDNFRGPQAYLQYTDAGGNQFSWDLAIQNSTDVALFDSNVLTCRTRPFTVPVGGVPTLCRLNVTAIASGAGTFVVDVSRVSIIRIA
jgi:lysophospholipase L1-like esterase